MKGFVYCLSEDFLPFPVRILTTYWDSTIVYTVYDEQAMDRSLYSFTLKRDQLDPLLEGLLAFMACDANDGRCVFFDLLTHLDCWRIRTHSYGLFISNTPLLTSVVEGGH